MNRMLSLVVTVVLLAGCGGSRGKLVNPTQKHSAIDDDTPIILHTDEGYLRVGLDGSQRVFLTRGDKYPVSISPDGNLIAISNPDTDLFIRDLRYTGEAREITSYRGRAGGVAVSPDGKLVAVTRHADYSTSQSTWSEQEDNSIDIISTETLEVVTTIEATEKGWYYYSLWFGPSGLIYTGSNSGDVIDPENGVRKKAADDPDLIRLRNTPTECDGAEVRWKGWRGDEGLEVVREGGAVEHIVRIEGRERGFHDYLPTVDSFFFVPSCEYVVFEFYDAVYAVDVKTQKVAKIADAYSVFMGPRPAESAPEWDPNTPVDVKELDTHRVFVTAKSASVCPTQEGARTNDCGNSVEFADKGYIRRNGETVRVVGQPTDGFYRAIRYTKAGTLPSWVDASKVAAKPSPLASNQADSRYESWRLRADELQLAARDTGHGDRVAVEPFVFLVERGEKAWALRLPECAAQAGGESHRYMLFHGCLMNADCDSTDYVCDEDYCDEIVFSLDSAEDFEHEGKTYPSKQVVELVDRMGRFVETDLCE